jgi:hypothetical protein
MPAPPVVATCHRTPRPSVLAQVTPRNTLSVQGVSNRSDGVSSQTPTAPTALPGYRELHVASVGMRSVGPAETGHQSLSREPGESYRHFALRMRQAHPTMPDKEVAKRSGYKKSEIYGDPAFLALKLDASALEIAKQNKMLWEEAPTDYASRLLGSISRRLRA